MIKHTQTIYVENDHKVPGNCLQACLASVLEVDMNSVPHFTALGIFHWFDVCNLWLEAEHKVRLEYRPLPNNREQLAQVLADARKLDLLEHIIVSGTTRRSAIVRHACVGKLEGDTPVVVHDPHISRSGLTEIDTIYFLVRSN